MKNNIIGIVSILVFVILYYLYNKHSRSIISDIVMDKITEKKINELHPAIKGKAEQLVSLANSVGINLRIYEALRDFWKQQELFNYPFDGKDNNGNGLIDESGEKVTNAKPGESFHNFALAFDVVEIKNGKAIWDNPRWETIGKLGESVGLEWGGRWKFTDKPHFQIRNLALSTAQKLYASKNFDEKGFIKLS